MPIGSEQFREIFGSFPTAVAIITAVDEQGEPRGFTCNAVCSVSVTPPLLLISVDKRSQTLPALESSQAFVVNFLSASGQEASQVFAGKGQDKFTHVRWLPSEAAGGAPILSDTALAYAECRVVQTVEAGDHWLFIGQVEGGDTHAREPLLYCKGEYSIWPQLASSGS